MFSFVQIRLAGMFTDKRIGLDICTSMCYIANKNEKLWIFNFLSKSGMAVSSANCRIKADSSGIAMNFTIHFSAI